VRGQLPHDPGGGLHGGVLGARRKDTAITAHHHLPEKLLFRSSLDTPHEILDGFTSRWGPQPDVDLLRLPHPEDMARPHRRRRGKRRQGDGKLTP